MLPASPLLKRSSGKVALCCLAIALRVVGVTYLSSVMHMLWIESHRHIREPQSHLIC